MTIVLKAIVTDCNDAQKDVLRARIVLYSADRLSVPRRRGALASAAPAVWRWQRRFDLTARRAAMRC